MESEIQSNTQGNLYEKLSNSWNVIFDFLDINSLLQSECTSKYFRNQVLLYYESKQNTNKNIEINNSINENEKKEHIKMLKKNFLVKYFNLFVHINISDKKFCNENTISTPSDKEEKIELQKKSYLKTESIFFKNRTQIEQISLQENKFLILYSNNIFSILEFDLIDTTKKFNEIFSYNFTSSRINNFMTYESQKEKILLFIKENSTEIFYLNLKEKDMKLYDLKKEYDIFNEENLVIRRVFSLNDFLLFFTNKDEFILLPNNKLDFLNKNTIISTDNDNNIKEKKEKEKKEDDNNDDEDEKKEEIIYPKKLENNYGGIKHIYSNNSNVIFLNNDYQIYSMPTNDYKNYMSQIPKFKLFSEQKFPNFYTMGCSNNFFLLLEKEKVKPLEEWNNQQVYKWFKEMNLDDYLNIIKNQKITGKDIVQGGRDYLLDFMGFLEDDLNKLNYEMNTLRFETSKDMKLWGWGSNKNGQLGLVNYQNFVKVPTQINLPNMSSDDDTIESIFCGKTYTVLLTKFGNLFVTGNYSVKEQTNNIQNNNNNKDKKNKGKNKHHKDEHKEKAKKNDKNKEKNKNKDNENNTNDNIIENKWINISQNICYSSYNLYKNSNKNEKNNNSFFKVKNVFCQDNNIFFIGFYSNTIPFFAVQRKPKFKHLKKGGKFITSTKVIEHIQEFLKDKMSSFSVVYGDSLLKMLETNLPDYLQSEIPFHKIIQLKDGNEVIWDRKKRYFKESFIRQNINK